MPRRGAGILFPKRHINVGRSTLNRYYHLSYLSGLMAGRWFTSGAERASLVIHYPRDISEFTFLPFYSADKPDHWCVLALILLPPPSLSLFYSRYSDPIGFDLRRRIFADVECRSLRAKCTLIARLLDDLRVPLQECPYYQSLCSRSNKSEPESRKLFSRQTIRSTEMNECCTKNAIYTYIDSILFSFPAFQKYDNE